EGKEPIELLDEIEKDLNIQCVPVTWPVGMGSRLKGIYHLEDDYMRTYDKKQDNRHQQVIANFPDADLSDELKSMRTRLMDEIELVQGAGVEFNKNEFLQGKQTPVFFGSALHNFGIEEFLRCLTTHAPAPGAREAVERTVQPDESKFTGFVFKIQAN